MIRSDQVSEELHAALHAGFYYVLPSDAGIMQLALR